MRKIFFASAFIFLFLTQSTSRAEVIEFSEDELARESVLPVFDQPEAVKRRYVPFDGRFEVGAFVGATLNDPFFNTYPFGLELKYHLSNFHAFGLSGSYHLTQQANYVDQIRQLPGGSGIAFNSSPTPSYTAFADYQFTPYYGKISFTKQGVMNMSFSGTLGVGMIGLKSSDGTSDSSVGFSAGINQRLFFTRNFGLKVDLKMLFYQQNDIVDIPASKKLFTNLLGTLGIVYLFPSL